MICSAVRRPSWRARCPIGDGEAPGRWIFTRLGDHRADRANFPLVGGERFNIIHVPKFHVLFPLRILVALAPSLDLPEGECVFERLVLFLLEHQEAAVAVIGELGHHRPIGVESVEHQGVDEPSIGIVQGMMRRRAQQSVRLHDRHVQGRYRGELPR